MRVLVIVGLFFCVVTPASAALKVTSPSQACSLLSDSGLNSRGWKNQYDQVFGCSSPYKEFGSGYPLANNIAFYADGTSNSVNQLKLVLNVNDRPSSSAAHLELVKAASSLAEKTTGEKLPKLLIDSINKGTNATQRVGISTVEVIRSDWSNGKGYEIKILIK